MATQTFTTNNAEEIIAAIYTFATTQGWSGFTSTNLIQLQSGNCRVAIEAQAPEVPFVDAVGDTINNQKILAKVSAVDFTGAISSLTQVDQLALGTSSQNAVQIFDTVGTTTVFCYGNSEHIHVFVRAADQLRFSMLSFGVLDKGNFTQPDVAFITCSFMQYWATDANPASTNSASNNPERLSSNVFGANFQNGRVYDQATYNLFVPSGVVTPALGYPAGDFMVSSHGTGTVSAQRNLFPANARERTLQTTEDGPLQVLGHTTNQLLTGGSPMVAIPVIIRPNANNLLTYLGEVPGLRCVDMEPGSGFESGQPFPQGADNWVAYPWCRPGPEEATRTGSNPQFQPNSSFYGVAAKS